MSLKLHTETTGQGPELFLIHGWALHSGVWDSLMPELMREWRVTCVDLPGHGRSRSTSMPATLEELARVVVEAAPENALWLGWSLGGLVALRAALDYPERMRGLVLTSTTPRFVTAPDWHCAMTLERLQEFMAELQQDYHGTVQRFIGLQVQGAEHARETLRQLRSMLLAGGEPDAASLAMGLDILRNNDLRNQVPRLNLPALVISGGHDRLTPPEAAVWLAGAIPGAQLMRVPRAAHAPFLSHPAEFVAAVEKFMQRLSKPDASGNRP